MIGLLKKKSIATADLISVFAVVFTYYNLFFIQYQILLNGKGGIKNPIEILFDIVMFIIFTLYFFRKRSENVTAERGTDSQSDPYNRQVSPLGKGGTNI